MRKECYGAGGMRRRARRERRNFQEAQRCRHVVRESVVVMARVVKSSWFMSTRCRTTTLENTRWRTLPGEARCHARVAGVPNVLQARLSERRMPLPVESVGESCRTAVYERTVAANGIKRGGENVVEMARATAVRRGGVARQRNLCAMQAEETIVNRECEGDAHCPGEPASNVHTGASWRAVGVPKAVWDLGKRQAGANLSRVRKWKAQNASGGFIGPIQKWRASTAARRTGRRHGLVHTNERASANEKCCRPRHKHTRATKNETGGEKKYIRPMNQWFVHS